MKPKNKRLILIIAGLFSITLAIYIILDVFNENLVFFYSPTDLKNKELTYEKTIRIGGLVKSGSIQYLDKLNISFILTDNENEITVFYNGILPSLFREEQGIIATGKLTPNKEAFTADELLAKHDENYMPPEVADSLKKKKTYD